MESSVTTLEATATNHESRLSALEAGQYVVQNVYDRTPTQGATGGTKNTHPVRRTGGVYPRRRG